jgi:hypothetical protein
MQIAVVNSAGILVASSLGPIPAEPVDLSDRAHVRVHLHAQVDSLFISKPVLGRISAKWSIQLSRPIFTKAGSLTGAIIVSLDPAYLARM